MSTVVPIAIATDPIVVQLLPLTDCDAVIVLPLRTSFTQVGAPAVVPVMLAAAPPVAVRYWNAVPFPAETIMNANCALAASELRIITPAFVQLLTFWTVATRAMIWPSPFSD